MKKLFGVLALTAGLLVLSGCDLYQPDVDFPADAPRSFGAANRGG